MSRPSAHSHLMNTRPRRPGDISWLFILVLITLWTLGILPGGPGTATANASTTNHIIEQHWVEDPTGEMTLAQIQAQSSLTPFDGLLTKGYGASTLWIKLRIDPSRSGAAADDPLYLRIRPNYLDELILYDPSRDTKQIGATGDRYPLEATPNDSTRFTFRIEAGDTPRDLWVALKSTSTRLARFEVLDRKTLIVSGAKLDLAGSLYLGLLSLFIVWGLIQFYLRPETLMLSFIIYLTCAGVFGASMLGYTRLLLDGILHPATLDQLTSLMAIIATAAALTFDYLLLNEINVSRWRRRIFLVMLATFLIMLGQLASGDVIAALKANMIMILIGPIIFLIMALLSRPTTDTAGVKKVPRFWVVTYAAITLTFTLIAAAPSLGLIKAAEFSLYIVLFYSITSGLLMLLILTYRAHILLKDQQTKAAKALAAEQRAEQERADRLDRENLLAMIGHELKTPMATLRMLTSHQTIPEHLSKRMDASVLEMAGVVDRVVQTGKLADQAARVSLQQCRLDELISALPLHLSDDDRRRLHFQPATGATSVIETDAQILGVILRNLVDNALKYSAPETPIMISYEVLTSPDAWCVEITNQPGRAGWPDPANMFKKYYRSPLASYRTGSGLGLYIVHELAKQLGAAVIYAPDNEHIRFRVTHVSNNKGNQP